MNNLRGLKQKLSAVSRLWDEEDYDQALAEVEDLLENYPGNPHLLVLKASLAQLQEEAKYDLDHVRMILQQAIEFDRTSPEASIEFGRYLDQVEDDPQAAIKAYGDGIESARHLLIEELVNELACERSGDPMSLHR